MKEVNEIRAQIGQLRAKIAEAENRLADAGLRHLGLAVGDRIITKKGEAVVNGCDARYGEPRILAVKVKVNGDVGHQSAGYIHSYEWTKKP